jgi:hypothetical protein
MINTPVVTFRMLNGPDKETRWYATLEKDHHVEVIPGDLNDPAYYRDFWQDLFLNALDPAWQVGTHTELRHVNTSAQKHRRIASWPLLEELRGVAEASRAVIFEEVALTDPLWRLWTSLDPNWWFKTDDYGVVLKYGDFSQMARRHHIAVGQIKNRFGIPEGYQSAIVLRMVPYAAEIPQQILLSKVLRLLIGPDDAAAQSRALYGYQQASAIVNDLLRLMHYSPEDLYRWLHPRHLMRGMYEARALLARYRSIAGNQPIRNIVPVLKALARDLSNNQFLDVEQAGSMPEHAQTERMSLIEVLYRAFHRDRDRLSVPQLLPYVKHILQHSA